VTDDRPFDPGLQPERTFLAWQRTVLALAVACAVAVRFTAPQIGAAAVIAGIAGLGLAIAAYIGVRYRYRRAHSALQKFAALYTVGSGPLAALAASTFMLGVLAALFLWGGTRLTP
jgi:uncharacterized membrane protein YidH (DUF202 family)